MARRRAAVALFALALVACTRGVAIEVTKTGEAIDIAAIRGSGAGPPCIQGLIVTQAGADIASTPTLWEISTAEAGRCLSSFRYGEVPAGYSQSSPAPSLIVGSRYMVEISGPGLQSGREFTVGSGDGPLTNALGE